MGINRWKCELTQKDDLGHFIALLFEISGWFLSNAHYVHVVIMWANNFFQYAVVLLYAEKLIEC